MYPVAPIKVYPEPDGTYEIEVWRQVPGWEAEGYWGSDHGRVRKHEQVLRPDRSGPYDRYTLTDGRVGAPYSCTRKRRFCGHQIIALTFIGHYPSGCRSINHKDGSKRNNRPENLEYTSHSANNRHAYEVLGRLTNQGTRHGMCKLTEANVVEIRALRESGEMLKTIAAQFAVTVETVYDIVRRRSWKHI